MDIATKKLNDSIHEYLDDIHGRSKLPVGQEAIDAIQSLADLIQRGDLEAIEDLSPGQKEAAEANEGMYREVALEEADSLSPGKREAAEFSVPR